jgi:signal transduction histidine kinase
MRREFVANVSHELRTPLTVIKGFAEALIDDEATIAPEARSRFMSKILNHTERLNVLVEDLLVISRLESKAAPLDILEQPLAPLLEEIAESYRARIDPQLQAIVISIDEAVGAVCFDRFRIQQVLENFLENALRYASGFTLIQLDLVLQADAGRVQCSVSDDGAGIPARDLPQIFERFYRVDKGRSRQRGGSGLGLSIAKHIIQLHGGEVGAESTEGVGTRMSFWLPMLEPSVSKAQS